MDQVNPIKAAPTKRRPSRAATLMAVRVWHSYAGAFFAPAFLFFSITGAVQTFNLHKPTPSYRPPAVLLVLASMHKNQNLHVKSADDAAPKMGQRARAADKPHDKPPLVSSVVAQWMLKMFVALVAAGLAASRALGPYMSLQTSRRRAVLLCFAAGTALPMLMTLAI